MTLLEATKSCLRNFTHFSGRSPRSEYWKFVLFIFLGMLALAVAHSMIFGPDVQSLITVTTDANGAVSQTISQRRSYTDGWWGDVFMLLTALPLLAVTWRRMHDTGKPGWHILVPFPAVIGIAYAALALAPRKMLPIDTSGFGKGYSGPTELPVPNLPIWLMTAIWVLALATFVLSITWLARRSQPGPNRYGPNPHEVAT